MYIKQCSVCQKKYWVKQKPRPNQKQCRGCSSKEKGSRPEAKARIAKIGKSQIGTKNPFYGKTHSEETILHLKAIRKNQVISEAHRDSLSKVFSGKGNPMFGKVPYDIWLEKYGKEEADKRQLEMQIKQKATTPRGKDNYMFGKPPPKQCGNGYGGKYKGIYFRSLRELAFFINYIEKNGYLWETGEQVKYRVPYINYKGERTHYYPDFILNGTVYECKPKRLWKTIAVKIKAKTAVHFFKTMGLKYKLIDMQPNFQQINELYINGDFVFNPLAEKKFIAFKERMLVEK